MDLSDAPGMFPEDAILSLFWDGDVLTEAEVGGLAEEKWGMGAGDVQTCLERLNEDGFLDQVDRGRREASYIAHEFNEDGGA